MSDEPMVPTSSDAEPQPTSVPVPPQDAPMKKRSTGLIVGVAVLLLAVAAGVLLWNNYTSSPPRGRRSRHRSR